MVLLDVKKDEKHQLFVDLSSLTTINDALNTCVGACNIQSRLLRLCDAAAEACKGQTATGVEAKQDAAAKQSCIPELVASARALVSKDRAAKRQCSGREALQQALASLADAILCRQDSCNGSLQALARVSTNLDTLQDSEIDVVTTELWFAGKVLARDRRLQDYVGANEKTTVVVKLRAAGDLKPQREPAVGKESRAAMLAWQFRRQQELQAIDADDLECGTSAWADSRALRQALNGLESVRLR